MLLAFLLHFAVTLLSQQESKIVMCINSKLFFAFILTTLLIAPTAVDAKSKHKGKEADVESTGVQSASLWRDPVDITSRNLLYGAGGEKHQPHTTYTFVKEDLDGTNPKFVVRDENDVKWKVKMGEEARPETAASRLVWSVGYFTDEDYFVKDLQVQNMPAHLHRGQKLVDSDGSVHNVRLKRELPGEKKIGVWKWRTDPFSQTRELNVLRVMMALINNWDLKDENNAIHEHKGEKIYLVSDLGASFGTPGADFPHSKAKGNLQSYSRSKFMTKTTSEYVDFQEPARPSLRYVFNLHEYFQRRGMEWIGRHVPRTDAAWMGQLLNRLSAEQIGDAFRAAGYSPDEVQGFSAVVTRRIAALNAL
jgi:hypothetical protein